MPSLTESDIQTLVGSASFERGERYFRQGEIRNPRLQGQQLKAQCQGSSAHLYRVEVTLGSTGVVSDSCSCPIGGGCKHVAALLLTWLQDPDDFLKIEELQTALERRTKDELVALIRLMLTRYPDLESLLELPLPGSSAKRKPMSPELIRRQVAHAFAGGYDEWDAGGDVVQQLESILELATQYMEAKDWRNAATVYQVVAQESLDHYESVNDEDGELGSLVNGCVDGLGQCLHATDDPAQREAILRALFDIYYWDVEFGGIAIGDEAPGIIAEQASREEKRRVAEWVRTALPAGQSWSDNYHRQVLGRFLLDLASEEMDDQAYLRIAREAGLVREMVGRLLDLRRVDEAIAVAQEAEDHALPQLADLLRQHGHGERAREIVRARTEASKDSRLLEWLKDRAKEAGDTPEALLLAERLFWSAQSMHTVGEVKDLAQQIDRWTELHAKIVERLTKLGNTDLLTQIHLAEGDVDRALETVELRPAQAWGWGRMVDTTLVFKVAQAAEERRPRDAVRLYMGMVQQLINQQGRQSYTIAAGYLKRVRDTYRRIGEDGTWQTMIANLRTENKRLRALKEELDKAGL